eukprot:contig_30033_g7354
MRTRVLASAAVAAAAAVWAAPVPTAGLQTYAASAVLEPSVATLHWTLNDTSVRFGLVITDAAVVTANASALWLGLGVGEPTSGGMLGADIVTGEFGDGPTCRLVDRHVPSVAYPLGSSAGGGRGAFPEPDDCGSVPTWALVGCAVDPAAGTLTLEVSRDLAAGDPAQDRPIVPGRNVFLYSYGDGFAYHGARRKSVAVDLLANGPAATGDRGLEAAGRLPSDVVASQLLTMPNYLIPTNRTEYACASFTVDLPPAGSGAGVRRQVVAAEAVVDKTTTAGKMVHHFLIFSCAKEGFWEQFASQPGQCFDESPNCRDVVWVWAAGADPLVMPPDVGFPVTEEERYYVVQTHYDNPTGVAGVVDNSSVLLHFSDTPRTHEAGTISVGDALISLSGQAVEGGRNYTFTCPSECTSQMEQPSITVFASMLHAHLTGLRLWTNLYRNGSFVRTIEAAAFWSNEHQRNSLLEANTTLLPGDELRVSCEYDVAKVTAIEGAPPVFGLGTSEEMCMSFLFVYPRPTLAAAAAGG